MIVVHDAKGRRGLGSQDKIADELTLCPRFVCRECLPGMFACTCFTVMTHNNSTKKVD